MLFRSDLEPNDGCDPSCHLDPGYACDATSCWLTVCGDGITEGTEQCDPGPLNDVPGCTETCEWAGGDDCTNAPSLNSFFDATENAWIWSGDTTGAANDFTGTGFCADADEPDMVIGFVAPEAGLYAIDLVMPGVDAVLYVWDATCGGSSQQLACADSVDPGGEWTSVSLTANQQIYVVVDGYGTSDVDFGPFTLTVSQIPNTEVEPNDSMATATPLVVPGAGKIASPSDVDFWSFPVTAGVPLLIATSATADGTCFVWDFTTDTYLVVYDENGVLVAENDDWDFDFWCSIVSVTPTTTGTWYAEVRMGPWAGEPELPLYFLHVIPN